MITLEQFYTVAKRCGYEVYTDDNVFHHLYYKNDPKMNKQMARYFDASYNPKEATLYEPISYVYLSPNTFGSKDYDDRKLFEKDLLKNTFTMKKNTFLSITKEETPEQYDYSRTILQSLY